MTEKGLIYSDCLDNDPSSVAANSRQAVNKPGVAMATSSACRPSFFIPVADGNGGGVALATVANGNGGISFDMSSAGFPGNAAAWQQEMSLQGGGAVGVAGTSVDDLMDVMSPCCWSFDDILTTSSAGANGAVDLFDLDSCDLCAPTEGMRSNFEKLLEVSTSKS